MQNRQQFIEFSNANDFKQCSKKLKKEQKKQEKKIQKLSKQLKSLESEIMASELQQDNKALKNHT